MKKNYCTLLQLGTLFIFSTLSFTNLCYAEKIYTWKDESGKMHYTNNPAMVPLKKDANIIKMKALPAPPEPEPILDGKALWAKNCSQCHNLSKESVNFKAGIPNLIYAINNPATNNVNPIAVLQAALIDQMDDEADIKLTDSEIKAIVKYVRDEVTLTIPIILDAPRNEVK